MYVACIPIHGELADSTVVVKTRCDRSVFANPFDPKVTEYLPAKPMNFCP